MDTGWNSGCFTVIGGEEMNTFGMRSLAEAVLHHVHGMAVFSHEAGCKMVERVCVNRLLFIIVRLLLAIKHFPGMLFNMA